MRIMQQKSTARQKENTLLWIVVIWLESPRDDTIPGSFFVSDQFQVAKGKAASDSTREQMLGNFNRTWQLPLAWLKHRSEHASNTVSHK